MISILLVDDQPAVRLGLSMQLSLEADLAVVGEAGDGEAALSLANMLQPDVILMDIRMPGLDGITTTAALRAIVPASSIVILSLYDDENTRRLARAAGSRAFIGKQEPTEALLNAIREAAPPAAI